jgi:2-dehydro-3-deoxy-D-arabinonate dehydratase
MKLFKTSKGIILSYNNRNYTLKEDWDKLINREHLFKYLNNIITNPKSVEKASITILEEAKIQAPIGSQEIWAAGVTYLRSCDARMEESKDSGSADFYSKVYHAERPELFFKATPGRVSATNEEVFIRRDSKWNVPEPELTLFINSKGKIQGYTIGNDMSSRDIEGENPLYLPQAKVYDRSAALGPCLFITEKPISPETMISITIERNDKIVFKNTTQLNRMKRNFTELIDYLFRESDFNKGVFLMTGTGIVPPNDFTLHIGDIVKISIENIGTLLNTVAYKK